MNASRSPCHCLVRRVITEELSPADDAKKPSNAGTKSPVDMPCKYMSDSTSATFGLLRHHGGMIELRNRHRSPVSSSIRLSSTRGCSISTAPAPVVIDRGPA
jgi:hypothetical protein